MPIPDGWDKQGIGRRLFFFPERSLTEAGALNLAVAMVKATPRALALTPDDRSAGELKEKIGSETGYRVFSASEIEQTKETFVSTKGAVAIVANRYDGIDMLHDECRLLIVKGLPRATNLQEKFLVTRLAATVLLNDRIRTRIVQAIGRCTRSPTDYAAIVILGEELNKHLTDPKQRSFLHPEIQAELEFGINESKEAEFDTYLENLGIFLKHKREWDEADEAIIAIRNGMEQNKLPAMDKLMQAAPHEVDYQYAIWNGDFESAVAKCKSVLTALSGDDVKGYRALWNYLCGSAAAMGAKTGIGSLNSIAREQFKCAAACAVGVRWLIDLGKAEFTDTKIENDDRHLASVVEALELELELHGTANDRRFEEKISQIQAGLDNGSKSKRFENEHKELGSFLGFDAGKPDSDGAPDCWWNVGDDFCIVFEDYSEAKPNAVLGATKVRQAASHPDWIRHNLKLPKHAKIVPVMVSPATKIEEHALPHTKDVLHWNLTEFVSWAKSAISIVREVRRTFPGAGDLEWRQAAMERFKAAKIDPMSIREKLGKTPLSEMPVN